MKKNGHARKRKRTTFLKIFARTGLLALVITALFSLFTREFIKMFIYEKMSTQINENISLLQSLIDTDQTNGRITDIQSDLCIYTRFEAGVEQHWFPTVNSDQDGNFAIAILSDSEGDVVYDSRNMFLCSFVLDGEGNLANGKYYCDYNRLGIEQLKDIQYKYTHLENYRYAFYTVRSAVINIDSGEFVPTELEVSVCETDPGTFETNIVATDAYSIDANGFRGETYNNLDTDSLKNYPLSAGGGFWGAEGAAVDELEADMKGIPGNYTIYSEQGRTQRNVFTEQQNRTLYLDGKEYTLQVRYMINVWNKGTKLLLLLVTLCALAGTMLIALLYSWRRHVLNKAQYAFEDYQMALTNNLAHDIKTPLAAIGGYAENLKEHCNDEKEERYLKSILDNVAFTDQLVSRTLDLNSRSTIKELNITEFSLRELVKECIDKYLPLLEQRGIRLVTEGEKNLRNDRIQYLTAIENLLSNAVKHSCQDACVRIVIGEKSLLIENDISCKIDTKSLKMPFVKGDKSRTDRSGSGLGLSIAEAALELCGSRLEISSTDTKFRAEIRY